LPFVSKSKFHLLVADVLIWHIKPA
jgi:hypothetical protein